MKKILVDKTWYGLTNFDGSNVWHDGENIYYSDSDGSNHYVLDKSTSTWNPKTWSGLDNIKFENIWTDGENVYYSDYTFNPHAGYTVYEKVLNGSNWDEKSWSGASLHYGKYIWTDGETIYYSEGSIQHVLDKSTSKWSNKTWSGLTEFNGDHIWTDGDNVYYSYGDNNNYVLDKSTSTWSKKTWNGLTAIGASLIWTDGENVYHSNVSYNPSKGGVYGEHYVLDKATSTWSEADFGDSIPFYGSSIWTDGNNIYSSFGSNQKVFVNETPNYVSYNNATEILTSVKTYIDGKTDEFTQTQVNTLKAIFTDD